MLWTLFRDRYVQFLFETKLHASPGHDATHFWTAIQEEWGGPSGQFGGKNQSEAEKCLEENSSDRGGQNAIRPGIGDGAGCGVLRVGRHERYRNACSRRAIRPEKKSGRILPAQLVDCFLTALTPRRIGSDLHVITFFGE
jgi:hypothetical protein